MALVGFAFWLPASPITAEEPTADQFYLKIENLIDNVADLDVRRFTILVPAGRIPKFLIGDKGIRSYGQQTADDKAEVRRLEAIIVLELHGDAASAKIRRVMKFQRAKGTAVYSETPVPWRQSLAGVVDIKVKSGRYPLDKPLVVGTVNGESVIVTVE
jgi:hypothetical protein